MDATTWSPVWRKSRRCDNQHCVEVALSAERVGLRDSKDPDGPRLWFSPEAWTAFVEGVKRGDVTQG